MIKTSFDKQTGILDSTFESDVSIEEIIDYIRQTRLNKSYPRSLKILTDATLARMDFSPANLTTIVFENNKSLEQYSSITDAIVLHGRRETALSLLYQELANHPKYRFEVFSNRESALQWLRSIA